MNNNNEMPKMPSFPALEREITALWKKERTFERSVENGGREKIFYDGPPFPTGSPHYGTVFVSVLKDLWARYFTMRGFSVPRRWGWDCHGLPIETAVEKLLEVTNKQEIEDRIGVDVFNEKCRDLVSQYNGSWETYIDRIGRWVDYDHAYRTMDTDFMESVIWAFSQCHRKGYIYKDYRVTPYCYRCQTSLSASDTRESDSTRPRKDTALTFRVPLEYEYDGLPVFALVWTTTPWTVPANLALCVNPRLKYGLYRNGNSYDLRSTGSEDQPDAVIGGADLEGRAYTPVFPYFAEKKSPRQFTILTGDFVSDDEGTGIVHLAPAFGEDDYWACREYGIGVENPVDQEGRYTEEVCDFSGENVHEVNNAVAELMQAMGVVAEKDVIEHNYPHCWRCRTPLIYRAMDAWYFNVGKIKERMLVQNQSIQWVPETVKDGRFGKWLEGARDWNLSRNRYWGTPIPVWECDDPECNKLHVPSSRAEIEERWGSPVQDLHKQHLDPIEFDCVCGGTMRRVPEVLDNWFESGAMPYGQCGYPFANKAWFESHFPADYIIEYTGQVRTWFYYLHVLAVALFDTPAFRWCLVHGTLLAEDGKKMSKSLANYTDPLVLLDAHGADALRLYLCRSPASMLQEMRFVDDRVGDQTKEVLLPLWNAVSFYVTYARIDGYQASPQAIPDTIHTFDRWILSRLRTAQTRATEAYDNFDSVSAMTAVVDLLDDLTNWYIRRSRKRFWGSGLDTDKKAAFDTLFYVLTNLIKLAAPVVPFISEYLYRQIAGDVSVHLTVWPEVPSSFQDVELENTMKTVRTISALGLGLRQKSGIKVRQPLPALYVVLPSSVDEALLTGHFSTVAEEINVKRVSHADDPGRFARIEAVPDPRKLGPRYGRETQDIIRFAKAGNVELTDGMVTILSDDDRSWQVPEEEVTLRYQNHGTYLTDRAEGIVVALDTRLTDELREEGVAMDINRAAQDMRKDAGYEVSDRIILEVDGDLDARWMNWLAGSALADLEAVGEPDLERCVNVEGRDFTVRIKKA